MKRLLRSPRVWAALFAAALLAAGLGLHEVRRRGGVPGWTERAEPVRMTAATDDRLRVLFDPKVPVIESTSWEMLYRYFFEGFVHYRTRAGARAHYPGLPSSNGRAIDGLEGFARSFVLSGAWLAGGRPVEIEIGERSYVIPELFAEGLVAGTNPSHPDYWGDIHDFDQQLIEAADIAVGLWLTREWIWDRMPELDRQNLTRWLLMGVEAQAHDGAWAIHHQLIFRSLEAIGVDVDHYRARSDTQWEFIKAQLYRGEGWFFDPPRGFDYYNAWGFHWALFWMQQIAPTFDVEFIRGAQGEFAGFFKHVLGPKGTPLLGRSPCYRTALPLPLVASAATGGGKVTVGEARRAMDAVWSYFIAHGALRDGNLTQGFCGPNPAILDRYSGPASCLWGLRSLSVALFVDRRIGLFTTPPEPLPVERSDVDVTSAVSGWRVTGDRRTATIVVERLGASGPGPAVKTYGLREELLEWTFQRPFRPDNKPALYGRPRYSSAEPLAACAAVQGP